MADDMFKYSFVNENVLISIKCSLKFVSEGPIDIKPLLVQVMAWRRKGDKPLSEPMIPFNNAYEMIINTLYPVVGASLIISTEMNDRYILKVRCILFVGHWNVGSPWFPLRATDNALSGGIVQPRGTGHAEI